MQMICQIDNILRTMKKKGYFFRMPDGSLGKITQTNLAKLLGEQTQTVNMWVIGRTRPPIDKAFRIAQLLGVKMEDLYSFEKVESCAVVKTGEPLIREE
ncbi:helix-turn-helix transcriptional regulator [Staphylospora marina]|uniref:helix-turn-helix transcriptional regulator n=1 Tax=Staphylospora marina TaxID=2490858 RepID=UPI0019D1D4D6|nr:helix-turn-helix transcriptional regulator [Staphylospora marina]